ncbi:MAG: DUF1638 domain-containing protein [Bacillota bacterium]
MKYFCYLGCSIMTTEVATEIPRLKTLVDLRLVPAGFHEQPEVLNKIIQHEIDNIEEWNILKTKSPSTAQTYDAILLGFGLCEKATAGVYARSIPLVIPRAHDCVTLLLGSKDRYQQLFKEKPGNYWYSCGWNDRMLQPGPEREEQLRRIYLEKYGAENAEFLMETEREWQKNYHQATFIRWDLPEADRHREYAQKCAAYLNWQYEEASGDTSLLRDFLNGDWDEERFLIVKPGEEIVPSYDEHIINSVKRN